MIADMSAKVESEPGNYLLLVGKLWLEYYYSSFIDGDNSPEGVKRLGYLLATDLYLDTKPISFRDVFQEPLVKKRRIP